MYPSPTPSSRGPPGRKSTDRLQSNCPIPDGSQGHHQEHVLVRPVAYSARLRCLPVGASITDSLRDLWLISHLKFATVNASERAFLRMLLDQAQESVGPSLREPAG